MYLSKGEISKYLDENYMVDYHSLRYKINNSGIVNNIFDPETGNILPVPVQIPEYPSFRKILIRNKNFRSVEEIDDCVKKAFVRYEQLLNQMTIF